MADEEATVKADEKPFSDLEFDPQYEDDFEGLAYLGRLKAEVKHYGHTFEIKTLTTGEKLEVAELCLKFEGTIAYGLVYQTAVVAGGLLTVDGQAITVPSKREGIIEQKYRYVKSTWFEPVIRVLYKDMDNLEGRSLELIQELGVVGGERKVARATK